MSREGTCLVGKTASNRAGVLAGRRGCLFSFAKLVEVLLGVFAAIVGEAFAGERVGWRVAEIGHFFFDGLLPTSPLMLGPSTMPPKTAAPRPGFCANLRVAGVGLVVLRRAGVRCRRPLPMPLPACHLPGLAPFIAMLPWQCSQPCAVALFAGHGVLGHLQVAHGGVEHFGFAGFLLHLRELLGHLLAGRRLSFERRLAARPCCISPICVASCCELLHLLRLRIELVELLL